MAPCGDGDGSGFLEDWQAFGDVAGLIDLARAWMEWMR